MSAAVAAAASAAISGSSNSTNSNNHSNELLRRQIVQVSSDSVTLPLSRYELQKRRDWSTFGQYLRNHRPPITISHCNGEDVVEFLRYLDQSGKSKIHSETCANFGNLRPPGICMCPLKPACYSLDALIGRLRVAFGQNGGSYGMNPFKAPVVRLYIEEKRAAHIQRPCRDDDIVFCRGSGSKSKDRGIQF